MDYGTLALIAIGVAATVFVGFAYYWWEIRPAGRGHGEKR
jgi:hypothetical protein